MIQIPLFWKNQNASDLKKIRQIIWAVVDLQIDNNILWKAQNAPNCTIFNQNFWGRMSLDPLARVCIHIVTGLHTRLVAL